MLSTFAKSIKFHIFRYSIFLIMQTKIELKKSSLLEISKCVECSIKNSWQASIDSFKSSVLACSVLWCNISEGLLLLIISANFLCSTIGWCFLSEGCPILILRHRQARDTTGYIHSGIDIKQVLIMPNEALATPPHLKEQMKGEVNKAELRWSTGLFGPKI